MEWFFGVEECETDLNPLGALYRSVPEMHLQRQMLRFAAANPPNA